MMLLKFSRSYIIISLLKDGVEYRHDRRPTFLQLLSVSGVDS